jgi:LysR family transcriptional regulator AphB
LRRVLPAYGQPSVSLSLLYPSRQQMQKSVLAFVAFAVARFADRGTRP